MIANFTDRVVAAGLSSILHALIILVSLMPPGNYFFPFISEEARYDETPAKSPARSLERPVTAGRTAVRDDGAKEAGVAAVPYLWKEAEATVAVAMPTVVPVVSSAWQRTAQKKSVRSLFRQSRPAELRTPHFPVSTLVPKPKDSILDKMADLDDSYLLTDVYAEAIPAGQGWQEWLERAETGFKNELRSDILDGSLDMAFSRFIIHAEYFQLSKALLDSGLKPSFSLTEALEVYDQRLDRVAQDLPETLTGYGLIMLLQRYAENKYYPENGSGMLLDSLFHNLNDCEGGTKEILAYLAELYPELRLGSNRGMVRTSTGEFIGHMQVYIGGDQVTRKVLDNMDGIVVETTRVGLDSILPWTSGEVYPLEDFVLYYYPELIAGTPLADLYAGGGDGAAADMDIVGTSNNPLKKSYSGTSTLLSSQSYDLSSIRSRRIENEFLRSEVAACDPMIDPTDVDSTNLFANFVAVDGKLRRELMQHYLADMEYRDNQVMPQWKEIDYLAGYDDLAQTLAEAGAQPGYISPDPMHAVEIKRFATHSRFQAYMHEMGSRQSMGPGTGEQVCSGRTVLRRELLEYLFLSPAGPGVFFLPSPEHTDWPTLLTDLQNDCLAIEDTPAALLLLGEVEHEAAETDNGSLRSVLLERVRSRGVVDDGFREDLDGRLAALTRLFRGESESEADRFVDRFSEAGSLSAPSVAETFAAGGQTGINPGLIRDVHDFGGIQMLRRLAAEYGRRPDLQLTVHRAVRFVHLVASLTDSGSGKIANSNRLVWFDGGQLNEMLQLAMLIDRLQRLGGTADVSAELAGFVKNMTVFRGEILNDLLSYGLTRKEGVAVIRARLFRALGSLTDASTEMFPVVRELAELRLAMASLDDTDLSEFFSRRIIQETAGLLAQISAAGNDSNADLGGILSLMYLSATGSPLDDAALAADFLDALTRFGNASSLGKLAVGLVDDTFSAQAYLQGLAQLIASQDDRLTELSAAGTVPAFPLLVEELSRANIIVRLLLDLPAEAARVLAGPPPRGFIPATLWPGRWYLERVVRQVAGALARDGVRLPGSSGLQAGGAQAREMLYGLLTDFYADNAVRETFSLLSYLQRDNRQEGVKFRKMRDLRSIKDPSAVKVVKADRRVTLQDMSLLTLALDPANGPAEMRKSWEQTLAVINGHLDYAPFSEDFRDFLFAPNQPYLTENDHGFFYSPQAVEDLHNADSWGGRNDILLSSYLHFRNLPTELPGWLLRTAVRRSEFERDVLDRFSRLSFLPMILECTDDHQMLPESLFQAKWITRKPFGEDIFPATLLLLRLGYLDINETGNLVMTEKIGGGA